MSTNTPTAALSQAGVSIWLDDLSRKRITTGELERLIAERDVVGVTTNPTIFANAFADGESYTSALHGDRSDSRRIVCRASDDPSAGGIPRRRSRPSRSSGTSPSCRFSRLRRRAAAGAVR